MEAYSTQPPRKVVSPAAATPPQPAAPSKETILSFLLTNSSPAKPPTKWRFITPIDDFRNSEVPPIELVHCLGNHFTDPKTNPAGHLFNKPTAEHLSRLLDHDDSKFVVERDDAGRPVGICTNRQTLFLEQSPAISAAMLRTDGKPDDIPLPLLAVETINDLHVLRALGFDAVLSVGLQNLTIRQIENIFASDNGDNRPWRYQLLIADWNVTKVSLAERPRAHAILERLALVQANYAHDPGQRFSRWRPDQKTRIKIHDALEFEDADRVRELLKSSLPKRQLGNTWRYHIKAKPLTYLSARTQLQTLLAQSLEIPPVAEIKKCLDQFRSVSKKEVLAQLYELADRAKSPVQRATILQAAELAERWFETQSIVRAAKRVIAGDHPGVGWEMEGDEITARLRLTSMQLRLFDKIQQSTAK